MTKLCRNYDWDLVHVNMGYYFISGFVRDRNGNYVYFLKDDWDYLTHEKWLSENILIRTAKNREDYHGGVNHYARLNNLNYEIDLLFKGQPVKICKKVICRRFKKK